MSLKALESKIWACQIYSGKCNNDVIINLQINQGVVEKKGMQSHLI